MQKRVSFLILLLDIPPKSMLSLEIYYRYSLTLHENRAEEFLNTYPYQLKITKHCLPCRYWLFPQQMRFLDSAIQCKIQMY